VHNYDAQQHRAGQVISPLSLQTITTAQMYVTKDVLLMCVDDAPSQLEDIMYRWSVDQLSLAVSTECVFDHVFDATGLYNVCVSAFNSGKPLSLFITFASFLLVIYCVVNSALTSAKQAAVLGLVF